MASAAPTKKPYRKAPPQHRETRHELQSSWEEGAELQSQVKAPHPVLCQRTCFSKAEAVELQDPDSSDACNLSCSSSWSLASSNDRGTGGRCTSRGRTQTLLRRVKSVRGPSKPSRAPRLCTLRRFLSRSEENIAVSAGEHREGKSRSLERSLVFKEPAEVLTPRKHRRSPCPQPLKSILKHPASLTINPERALCLEQKPARQLSPRAFSPSPVDLGRAGNPSPDRKNLEEKAKFSQFLDEITCRVLSPCSVPGGRRWAGAGSTDDELSVINKTSADGVGSRKPGRPADVSDSVGNVSEGSHGYRGARMRPIERKEKGQGATAVIPRITAASLAQQLHDPRSREVTGHIQSNICSKERSQTPSELCYPESLSSASQWSPEGRSPSPRTSPSLRGSHRKDSPTGGDRVQFLQQQNDDLRRRLAYTTTKMEALEHEVEAGRHYLELELGRNREELEKFKDKFRRLQNSYTASQRTNQDLEEKLHTLIKKAEMDQKTLDWEIVELTNKLLDAKTTINKLEELNERYRQDCNLAVQLLKCNKSHFRNHKFADLPYKLQDMVSKHLESSASSPGSGQDTPPPGLSHSEVVPTSVIARVLEKPESLILNSATSSSGSGPTAEDVFVHVDMSAGERTEESRQQNGGLQQQGSVDSSCEEPPTFEKLSPYPTPPPPHPLYPGRKVIEFSDEKVRIPKNSPLPNCTYATRQAISLSLVQGEEGSPDRRRTVPNSPASAGSYPQRARSADNPARSPVSSAAASSASSEEDMLANWQKMFVEKSAPSTDRSLSHRTSFSRDTALELQQRFSRSMQELSRAAQAYTERESSSLSWGSSRETEAMGTQKGNLPNEYGKEFSQEEAQDLLSGAVEEEEEDSAEIQVLPEVTDQESITEDEILETCTPPQDGLYMEKPPAGRPHRSPKRMGVHHLHRKDSLTRAQEQGNLLN